jgi:hypothetical protein
MVKWLKKTMKMIVRQNKNRTFTLTKKYKIMKKEFKVGDKVVISKKSKFYGDHYSNPTDVEGKITNIRDDYEGPFNVLDIKVEWDNGMKNSYNEVDLELAKQQSYIHDNQNDKNMNKAFKVGDKVMIDVSSEYYEDDSYVNPRDVEGTITEIEGEEGYGGLGIIVKWDNGKINGYNKVDLKLAKKESYIHDEEKINQPLKPKVMIKAITITDLEQIKALCKAIPSIKEQVQDMYPELFEVHKAGNRYVDAYGTEFILATESNAVALVSLKTGKIDATIYVDDINNITEEEMELVYNDKEYTLA